MRFHPGSPGRVVLALVLGALAAVGTLSHRAAADAKSGASRSAWAELAALRDSIAKDIESGKLGEIHVKSERFEPLGKALADGAQKLPSEKRTRIQAALRQLPTVAGALHGAADAGKLDATQRELKRLDGILQLVRLQYPEDALSKVSAPGEKGETQEHSDHSGSHAGSDAQSHEHGAHSHATRPLAAVDEAPRATLRVKAAEFTFTPASLRLRAGQPTRIELENTGAIEHALIVEAPDGKGDWIHLHAQGKSVDAGTFRIDKPGTYPILCTVAGHREAGMVGQLVVH